MNGGSAMPLRRPHVQKTRDEHPYFVSPSALLCECGPVRLPELQEPCVEKKGQTRHSFAALAIVIFLL